MDWQFHSVLRRFGVDVIRWPAGTSYGIDFAEAVKAAQVDVVFDVGGFVGEFGHMLRARGYTRRIVSFEPVEESYRTLEARATGDPEWEAHCFALGDQAETRTLRVYQAADLSSFLPVSPRGVAHFGSLLANVSTKIVGVERLDTIAGSFLRGALKIDTQGWDGQVLAGAEGVLDRILVVQVELSLRGYYDGTTDYLDTLSMLRDAGFEPAAFRTVSMVDGVIGETDCVLVRTRSAQPRA